MHFIGLTKEQVKQSSIKRDGYYEYVLGSPVEVTVLNSKRSNDVMEGISKDFKGDKLMSRYTPVNCIMFTESLIDNEGAMLGIVSYRLDNERKCIYIGEKGEFNTSSGALVLSGVLSLNAYVSSERRIMCTERMKPVLRDMVKVLAVGCRGDCLLGLYFVPSHRGIMVSLDDTDSYGYSTNTMKVVGTQGYSGYTLDYWFTGAKVVERGSINGIRV